MKAFRKRPRSVRVLLVSAGVGAILLTGAAIAIAAYPKYSVTVLTGCLSNGGTSAGNLGNVAVGSNPSKPCGTNQLLVHLSGGTITQVTAGTGLNGGGSNGFVAVGIKPSFQLPQTGCSSGQFVASDGASGWACQSQQTYSGSDFALSNQACGTGEFMTGIDSAGAKQCAADQTYTNGTGLDLSGNTFSLGSGYKLPQDCTSGQSAVSNGNNTWSCHSSVGGLSEYWRSNFVEIGDDETRTVSAFCNNGDIRTGGDAGINDSGPTGTGEGWTATAGVGFEFGFGSGGVTAAVDCLHLG